MREIAEAAQTRHRIAHGLIVSVVAVEPADPTRGRFPVVANEQYLLDTPWYSLTAMKEHPVRVHAEWIEAAADSFVELGEAAACLLSRLKKDVCSSI